jgi:hypothetical protein
MFLPLINQNVSSLWRSLVIDVFVNTSYLYCENRTKHIRRLFGRSTDLLAVKSGVTRSYQNLLKGTKPFFEIVLYLVYLTKLYQPRVLNSVEWCDDCGGCSLKRGLMQNWKEINFAERNSMESNWFLLENRPRMAWFKRFGNGITVP